MDAGDWLGLCARSLGVAETVDGTRQALARRLLEVAGQPLDVLSMGAAEAAIDVVTGHGAAGNLDEVLLGWEQAEVLATELGKTVPPDAGTARATACTKALLEAVVTWVEAHPSE